MTYISQFNYQLSGPEDGRRWVFLHGLMGYGANWRKIVSGLESTERILTYDQRGHGRSFKPLSGYSPEDFADDLFLITQELGWEKFILVGHSMGGRNALNFASRFSHKLEKLIIEDIGPDGDPKAPESYKNLLGSIPTPFEKKLLAKEFFMNQFPSIARAQGREQIETLGLYLYSNLEEKPGGGVDWRFSKDAILQAVIQGRAKDRWYELESVRIPTLIIRGENSKELSHEMYARMLKTNPLIQGVEIANAGHWVHSDQPHAFLDAIKRFVIENKDK